MANKLPECDHKCGFCEKLFGIPPCPDPVAEIRRQETNQANKELVEGLDPETRLRLAQTPFTKPKQQ